MGPERRSGLGVWAAFLGTCFLVLGLMGLFASYAGQVPLERAVYRLGVLDQVAAAGGDAAKLAALRPLLGDDAGTVLDGAGPVGPRIEAERRAALAEGVAESDAVSFRVRLMLLLVTLTCAGFGIGVMGMARRSP